jgi:hypothetical protein
MNDRELEKALAYLQENAGLYNLDYQRGQLLHAGYDPATVDRAIQIFQARGPEAPRHSNVRSCGIALLIGIVLCIVVGLLVFGLCASAMRNV